MSILIKNVRPTARASRRRPARRRRDRADRDGHGHRRPGDRRHGKDPAAGLRRPAHAPARTGTRGHRDHRNRFRRRGTRWLHGGLRNAEHEPGGRTRWWSPTTCGGAGGRSAWSTSTRSERSRSAWPASSSPRWARWPPVSPGVRMFSDDGKCVLRPAADAPRPRIRQLAVGVLVAQHAEEPRLTLGAVCGTRGRTPRGWGSSGWPRCRGGGDRRPRRAAGPRRRRACARLSRLHRRHGRTDALGEGLGISISAEVTPHHLLLDDSRLETYDAVQQGEPAAA